MIRQQFQLDQADGWLVTAYYAVTHYEVDEIMTALERAGCRGEHLQTAYDNRSCHPCEAPIFHESVELHWFRKLNICLITSTVHPLPSIVYCCVAEHSHLYHSGIVCKRAASVGVMRRTISSQAISGACPA